MGCHRRRRRGCSQWEGLRGSGRGERSHSWQQARIGLRCELQSPLEGLQGRGVVASRSYLAYKALPQVTQERDGSWW